MRRLRLLRPKNKGANNYESYGITWYFPPVLSRTCNVLQDAGGIFHRRRHFGSHFCRRHENIHALHSGLLRTGQLPAAKQGRKEENDTTPITASCYFGNVGKSFVRSIPALIMPVI